MIPLKKLFAALLAVLCLAGCGAKEQPQPAEVQPAPAVEEPTPAEPAPETPEVVEIPMETLPEEIPVEGLSIPDYETVSLEGLVEDAIGYVIDYPVFSGFDGAETVNGFYLNLAEHLERYTKETVYKDIAFGPSNMGKTGAELDACVRESAKLVGLGEEILEKSPFELSGGQKRRVALAGVMAMRPEVLILDEPTAGLDPAGRENLMANIRDYRENSGSTILLVSHSMDEVARNADRILVLKSAGILMQGTPREVFARGGELLSAGLDVPQTTRIAMALRRRGAAIDPAVYTVEDLSREILALRGRDAIC